MIQNPAWESEELYLCLMDTLLRNRQNLLEEWIKNINSKDIDGEMTQQSAYWLLFQTTCGRLYDPFKSTLKLGFLSHDISLIRRFGTNPEGRVDITPAPVVIMDEAQGELKFLS
jgi:hypothetical protein